jgi:hypothetical protein
MFYIARKRLITALLMALLNDLSHPLVSIEKASNAGFFLFCGKPAVCYG